MQTPAPVAPAKAGLLPGNLAGALSYLPLLPAVLFLLLEPFRKNGFVRFHSVQSLLLWAAGVVVALAVKASTLLIFLVPVLGPLLVLLAVVVAILAAVVLWLVLVIKALQGEKFKLPLLGEFALEYSNAA